MLPAVQGEVVLACAQGPLVVDKEDSDGEAIKQKTLEVALENLQLIAFKFDVHVAHPKFEEVPGIKEKIAGYWRVLKKHPLDKEFERRIISQNLSAFLIPNPIKEGKKVFSASPYPEGDEVYSLWAHLFAHPTTWVLDLTETGEPERKGRSLYYPTIDNQPQQYGDLTVTKCYESYAGIIATMRYRVSNGEQEVIVKRRHYYGWRDNAGLPTGELGEIVSLVLRKKGGVFVHCAMGRGRTGTAIIACFVNMLIKNKLFEEENSFTQLNDLIATARRDRGSDNFVATKAQYHSIVDYMRELLEDS